MRATIAPHENVADKSVRPLAERINKACESLGVRVESVARPGKVVPVLMFHHPKKAAIDAALEMAQPSLSEEGPPWSGCLIEWLTD